MALVLGIDTTAKSVSCALAQDDQIIGSFYSNTGLTHSHTLMKMIQDLLEISGKHVDDLDAMAVNAGPGSFTGVRIGVSAVKGLAFTNNVPCVSVSTLYSMAGNIAAPVGTIICSVMDARCQQVYTALFLLSDEGKLVRLTDDQAISISDLKALLLQNHAPIVLVGDGSELCYRQLKDTVPLLTLAPAAVRYQSASTTALIGVQKYMAGETVTAEELLPTYLRLPQAERELNSKLKQE